MKAPRGSSINVVLTYCAAPGDMAAVAGQADLTQEVFWVLLLSNGHCHDIPADRGSGRP